MAKTNEEKRFEIYINIVGLMELRNSKGVKLSENARINIANNAYDASVTYLNEFNIRAKPEKTNETDVGKTNVDSLTLFEKARLLYPGTKRGLETEYLNFRKKHKDHLRVNKFLVNAIINQKNHKHYLKTMTNEFVPSWPHFSTWINQRRWEEYIGETDRSATPKKAIKSESFL